MLFAVIDLGSNSFKMELSRAIAKGFKRVESFKTPVRFVSGIDAQGRLDPVIQADALSCLAAFREQLQKHQPTATIAVATESFRRLDPSEGFLAHANEALGQPIEVLSGAQEARLCYQGVEALLGKPTRPRLVIDVGGGSTQFVRGGPSGLENAHSVGLGCVVLTQQCFPDQHFTRERLERARQVAREHYTRGLEVVSRLGVSEVVGASGAFRTMLEAGSTLGYEEETLTRSAVHAVCERLFLRGAFSTKDFPDTPTERHAVFLACAAICDVLLDVLGTPTLMVCKSGLRAGLLQHLFVRSQWSQLAQ